MSDSKPDHPQARSCHHNRGDYADIEGEQAHAYPEPFCDEKIVHDERRDQAHEFGARQAGRIGRSEEHTSELQSLMRISYAVFCLKTKKKKHKKHTTTNNQKMNSTNES